MHPLQNLANEVVDAVGIFGLSTELSKLRQTESLTGNQDAINFIDSLIKRINLAKANIPSTTVEHAKSLIIDLAPKVFTNKNDLASRLFTLGLSAQQVAMHSSKMSQPGAGNVDDFLLSLSSSFLTSCAVNDTCGTVHHRPYRSSYYGSTGPTILAPAPAPAPRGVQYTTPG